MATVIKDRKFETNQIYRLLIAANVGDTISFLELSQAAGMPVTSTSAPFTSARRIALNEDRMVFESVRGVGVRRISDEELATTHSDRDIVRSRRHAKRSLKKLTCVENFSGMTNHAQLAHVIKSSFFGAVAFMARKNRLNDLSRAVAGRSSELPVDETLRAFLKNKN